MYRAKGFRQIKFTDEQLLALKNRYEAGESSRDLAKVYGIHQTTVVVYLRQLGATIRPASRPTTMTDAQLIELGEIKKTGKTWEDLGEIYGVNDKTLRSAYYRFLKRAEQ